jgi:hypothetical protein
MGIIPVVPELPIERGVAFNAPPPHLIADAIASVTRQMEQIPVGAHGAIVAVGTYGPGGPAVNAAIAVKGPYGVQIEAWIGKTWGQGINAEVKGVKIF